MNPGVTCTMFALGKCSYTEAYVRIAAQLGGGLVAFPLYHAISETMKWTPFGGPEFDMQNKVIEASISECTATFFLLIAIYILNWELHFGKYHYIIKQSLTAVAIRALIEFFPTAGPAMNPMLATTWNVFAVGNKNEFPTEYQFYFVYWICPIIGGLLSAIVYTTYAGGTIYGIKNPFGPIKKPIVPVTPSSKSSKKKKN